MSIKTTPYGFTPTTINNCALWLDGADSSQMTFSSGNNMSTWQDKSGQGKTMTAVGSPVYQGTSGGVYLNGTSQYFSNATSVLNNTYTIFFVYNKTSTSVGNLYSCYNSSANTSGYTGFFPTEGANYYLVRSDTSWATAASTIPNNNKNIVSVQYENNIVGGPISVVYNGSDNISSTQTGTITYLNFTIGYRSYGSGPYLEYTQGYFYEIVAYSIVLTLSQRQQVESYLAQKWGITLSLAGHPGLTSTVYQSTYLKTAGPKRNIATMTPFYTAFSPRQIAGCSHWFDATDSSTITLSSGSLTQWNDKSGNGRNLTAVSGFANATVSSAYQNGLNVFNFSGNGLYRTALGNVSYPLEVYIIVALKSLTTHVDVLGMGDTSTDNFNSLTFSESAASRWHNGSSFGNRQTISTSDETSLSFLLIQWSIANGNYLLRRNGTQLIQASQTYSFNNSATAAFQIGFRHTNIDAANFSGYIGEIVVFNNQIGTTDRQNVESYLAQKWGLTASLPGGHLQLTQPAGARTALSLANSRITITSRSVPFLPTSIAGIQMWMDGADPAGTGVVPSNGSVLSTWVDKSGKSFSATGVNSPTVVTNAVNSKSAVSYNGSSYSYSTIASGTFSTAMNIFFVYKVNGAVSYAAPMTRGQGNNGSPIDQYNVTRYLGGGSYNNIQSAYSHASATSTTLFTQLIQQSPSTTYNEYVNGSTTASATGTGFSASDAASYVYIGTRDDKVTSFNGYMCELIIYNSMVGLTAQQKIEGYLAWKWGIQASLPVGHPYVSAAP